MTAIVIAFACAANRNLLRQIEILAERAGCHITIAVAREDRIGLDKAVELDRGCARTKAIGLRGRRRCADLFDRCGERGVARLCFGCGGAQARIFSTSGFELTAHRRKALFKRAQPRFHLHFARALRLCKSWHHRDDGGAGQPCGAASPIKHSPSRLFLNAFCRCPCSGV